jgi:hypothetical protein
VRWSRTPRTVPATRTRPSQPGSVGDLLHAIRRRQSKKPAGRWQPLIFRDRVELIAAQKHDARLCAARRATRTHIERASPVRGRLCAARTLHVLAPARRHGSVAPGLVLACQLNVSDDLTKEILTRLKRASAALEDAQQASHALTRATHRAKHAGDSAMKPPARHHHRRKRAFIAH